MGWIECRCDAHWSRWVSNNWITRCHRKFELVRVWSLESVVAVWSSENQTQQRAGPSGPPAEQPRRMRKKYCYSQKSWGVNMLQSLFSLQLTTHPFCNPFVPFWMKCERYIFLKNCVSFVFIVLTMFLHAYEYVTLVPIYG